MASNDTFILNLMLREYEARSRWQWQIGSSAYWSSAVSNTFGTRRRVENPKSWQQQASLTFRMQLAYLQAYPTRVIQYAAKINIHSVKTTYPDTGMSSWYLLSLRIESGLLYPLFCLSRGKMWMAPFIASQARSISSCSSSVPLKEIAFGPAPHLNIHGNQSSHVCRVEGGGGGGYVEMKRRRRRRKAHTLIIQSCGWDSWQAAAERVFTPTNFNLWRSTPRKKYQRKHKKAVSFSQQLLQFFLRIQGGLAQRSTLSHSDMGRVQKEEKEKRGREREDRDIERLRESWCHPFGYVALGWVFFSDQGCDRVALSA